MNENLTIQFWRARGSHPAPGGETVCYGGNTACVEINAGGHTIILDAGTGLIPLGRDLARRARQAGKALHATLLFSHLRHDHTQGFPYHCRAAGRSSLHHPARHGQNPCRGQSMVLAILGAGAK